MVRDGDPPGGDELRTGWQQMLAAETASLLAAEMSVQAVWVVGSLGSPEAAVDAWSDVDLAVVVRDDSLGSWFPGTSWLAPVGKVWATDHSEQPLRKTTRVVFDDTRRLDVIFFAGSFGPIDLVGNRVWSRDTHALAAAGSHTPVRRAPRDFSGAPAPAPDTVGRLLNQFRFVASLAVVKLARADLLVGLHLTIECVRLVLVLAMIMRDDALPPVLWADVPETIRTMPTPGEVATALLVIEQSAAIFDGHIQAGYRRRLEGGPLEQLIARLRQEVSAPGTS